VAHADWVTYGLHEGRARPRPATTSALQSWVRRVQEAFSDARQNVRLFNNDPGWCRGRDAQLFDGAAERKPMRRAGLRTQRVDHLAFRSAVEQLLQEMRVMQTGVQVLTGFLLTISLPAAVHRIMMTSSAAVRAAVLLAMVRYSSSPRCHASPASFRARAGSVVWSEPTGAALAGLLLLPPPWPRLALIIDVVFNAKAGWVGAATSIVLSAWSGCCGRWPSAGIRRGRAGINVTV